MKKIEYCIRSFNSHELKEYHIEGFLNEIGGEGWELIQVVERFMINDPTCVAYRIFYFKRTLPNE